MFLISVSYNDLLIYDKWVAWAKGDLFMYEYVTKAEYQPVREELEKIIHKVQLYMKKNFKTSFQFKLIGSGKRHLITRVKMEIVGMILTII